MKQGDPINPSLFNTVLEKCIRSCKLKWGKLNLGIRIQGGQNGLLDSIRFADYILLLRQSLKNVQAMLEDLITEIEKAGLELHMDKTNIMTNGIGRQPKKKNVKIHNGEISILNLSVCQTCMMLKSKDA